MAYIGIDVDLTDFSDDDIREEAIARDLFGSDYGINQLITELYEKRRLGKDYQSELDKIIYEAIGKIV
jgi:hypothetical protein